MLKELAPFQRRPFRTADRSAVNPRGFNCDKEMPVKSRISRHDRLIALFTIQRHMAKMVWNWASVSPFSDKKMRQKSAVAGVQEATLVVSRYWRRSTASRVRIFIEGGRLITIHRAESHRLILQLLNSCNS